MRDLVDELIHQHGPDAVIEALASVLTEQRKQRIEEVLSSRLHSITIVLEDLYDPHNGAAAIRSAEAFGLTSVVAVENQFRFTTASGVTIGSHKWLNVDKVDSISACVDLARGRGMKLVATLPGADKTARDLDPGQPWAIVFGNEHDGLSAQMMEACDEAISIPMFGFTQSFNLSVSVALVLNELTARRREYLRASGDLSDATRHHLRARWQALGIRGVELLVGRHVSK